MPSERRNWFRLVLQLQGSVIPSILPRTVFCGTFGFLVSILYNYDLVKAEPIFGSIIPSIVLGLLLVFRTNTAYERFWEGRKCWGGITNTCRNLARYIWVGITERESQDRLDKIATLKLLVAFAVATKLHLRREVINAELEGLMAPAKYQKLKGIHNPPLEVAFWIGDYLQRQYYRGCVNSYQSTAMHQHLDMLVDNLGGCERILKTPMPLAYAIHLKQLLLLYSFLLPFQMVHELGWWTGVVTALVSFTLFGIEEIGIEIENPFGHDYNDLPLDAICDTMLRNIEDLISLTPTSHNYVEKLQSSGEEI
ncbi:hypothetical protein BST81_03305 [Leptolyngbya sp. 'hensonii']|uniref:bestrophin family protein n=1 Tax=Leptolyngbya sp. 'hensonii' TaxID=1922337 RepID=UPI00094F7CF5|nr:bestrophin family ion channel [Leptolyngbya sp. 'hensonii']OLP19869.1 hypothetical protein BST81_03305 [Leptolyngbya sp. 'hensonii']